MTALPLGIIVLGFGGHARSVADVALASGVEKLLFVDTGAKRGETLFEFPVLETMPQVPLGWQCFAAAGDNVRRRQQLELIQSSGWQLASVTSPRATIGAGSEIGAGCFVGHHCHVGPLAKVGVGCILNTGAVIEHDCIIGPYSHVSVNATLAGKVELGDRVFVGAGAIVINGQTVCSDAIVGAGAVVVSSLGEPGTYVGIPAKRLPNR